MTPNRAWTLWIPLLAACRLSVDADMSTGGEFGATQGGVQDMGLAREMIAAGYVPPPEAFVVEGMFSEHDLGVSGPACTTLLCLRGAPGIAPDGTGAPHAWLQVGLSSTIDPDHFERPSLTVVAVVDVSGSMGWTYGEIDGEYASPGQLSRELLHQIADQLGPQDQIALVTYGNDVHTPLEFVSGDSDLVAAAIDDLSEDGSTNMEAGLERAYRLATDADFGTDETRVMLFTDVQPNVGATEATDFERMAGDAASDGVGTTVFAMGVGMGQEVLLGMSHLRGGNAFSLFTPDDVPALMEDSWPWMVSPIAYDLGVAVTPASGFEAVRGYGFPAAAGGGPSTAFDVATVFLSKRKGALLVELAPGADVDPLSFAAEGELSYTTPDGEALSQRFSVTADGAVLNAEGAWFAQEGTARTVALALLVDGMKQAATTYGTDEAGAAQAMSAVASRYRTDTDALVAEDLQTEAELADALAALMAAGAQQAELYGWGQGGY